MNETLQMWLFGALFVCVGGGAFFVLQFSIRLTRMETMFDLLGKRAAKFLHSPDNHLGVDKLLELYMDHQHELTMNQWGELQYNMELIVKNATATANEKILAAFLSELCNHKLMVFRRQTKNQEDSSLVAK